MDLQFLPKIQYDRNEIQYVPEKHSSNNETQSQINLTKISIF